MAAPRSESEIKLSIIRNLSLYIPEIIVVERIFTGKAKNIQSSAWIHGAAAGTPDLFAILKYDGGHVLYIEVKREKGGSQRSEQKMFEHKILGLSHVHYVLARSVADVVDYVRKNILDKSLPDMLFSSS